MPGISGRAVPGVQISDRGTIRELRTAGRLEVFVTSLDEIMEIFFCSHCNQSIPLKDIQSGVAELRRGKYLCVTCKEIVSASREKAPNYAAMYLGIFLAGTLIVIGYLIFQEDLFPVPEPTRSAAPHDRNAILDSLEDLKTEFRDDFQKTNVKYY